MCIIVYNNNNNIVFLVPPWFPEVEDLPARQDSTQPRDAAPWLCQGKYSLPWWRLITSAMDGNTRVSTKEEQLKKTGKKESEKKKIEEGIEWREWMPDLRDKGIFQTIPYHYSACHVTPATGLIN